MKLFGGVIVSAGLAPVGHSVNVFVLILRSVIAGKLLLLLLLLRRRLCQVRKVLLKLMKVARMGGISSDLVYKKNYLGLFLFKI